MGVPSTLGDSFEPVIAGFFCEQCGEDSLCKSDETQGDYPANLKIVRIICAEKVGPDLIRQAFRYGADGVLICGCLVGKCKTLDSNPKVLAHIHQTKMVLKDLGLPQGRLRQEWVCDQGVEDIKDFIRDFTEHIRTLGPLNAPTSDTTPENT